MPRILSLKKAQPTVPPKNQKSIKQFFKSANTVNSQQQQKSPAKTQPTYIKQNEKKPIKRKALSQVELETVVIDDDESTTNNHGQNSTQKNVYNTPKKFKSDHETPQTSSDIRNISKKSPNKENDISKKFPRQSGDHSDRTNDFGNTEHLQNEFVDERLPLTPIKVGSNGENNEINDKLSTNNTNDNTNNDINEQKSSPTQNGNHVQIIENKNITPKKVLNFDNDSQNSVQNVKKNGALKSPFKGLTSTSRVAVLKTPEKLTQEELSPSKRGSTVKSLEFSPGALDEFGDQWDVEDVDQDCTEDLDLTIMQRCEVTSVTQLQGRLELRLKNSHNNRGTCCVEGVWLDTPLSPGETISVIASRNPSGQFYVGNSAGLIVLRPDHLISSTSVVAGVFCKRKAVLQERWRGLDAGNTAMTIGILVHELVQKALTQNIMDVATLHMETDRIIKESLQMLYDAGLGEEETKSNMLQYITPLADFMQTYVAKSPLSKTQKDQWKGRIEKVLDIEENVCCPQLGLKGKIDATIQVTIHERKGRDRAVVPLELKSGRASVSAEHRGQLVLYSMMLSLLRGEDPTTADNSGLLLYLKERVDVREVSCGYPERRDLVLLRNQLMQHLTIDRPFLPDNIADIEDAACFQQQLPEPINHQTACAKCPYLTLCSLHLWHTDGPSVSASHPLAKLRAEALGHLSAGHVQYFLRWAALLRAEEAGQLTRAPLHALWTDSADARSKRGTCAENLKLKSVESSGDRYMHVFERQIKEIETLKSGSKSSNGPQEGEFSIVSIDGRPWVAAGVVAAVKGTQISILLERDLSRRMNQDTTYHIDTYESYATTVQNLTNLGVLLEDSDRSGRLRRLIIDKQPPEFEKKLPREVGRLGSKLMKSLNIEQQRAVLKALAAKDYALLQGLPGTGKTQTISVLIQMLVGLKQRVLVTAHTHSAVDTVLSRLPRHLKVMRLGSSARVAASLLDRCEQHLVGKCETVKQLEELFESMEVVGVTCLGAAHAMLSRTSFDVCIVDEATQVVQSTVLRPLFAAGRFLLVGDPDQLPPVVRTPVARRLGMEESLFHLLMREDATSTLQLQYRMNQPLADLANKVAYDNRLKCADQKVANAMLSINIELLSSLPSWVQKACSPEPENAALFLDMATTDVFNKNSKSCTNVDEACVVMALVEALIQGGVNPSDIGVIAPYRDQVTLLRRVLCGRGVEGSTVDQFQGRDKPVILYSCTKKEEKDEDRKIKEGEILNDRRRLAVSVTRAKHKLLTVGNSRALQRYAPLQRLIEHSTVLTLDKNVVDSVIYKYKMEFV